MITSIVLAAALMAESPRFIVSTPDKDAVLIMQEGQFQCQSGERRFILLAQTGHFWVGCYTEQKGKAILRFEDGDSGTVTLPREASLSTP